MREGWPGHAADDGGCCGAGLLWDNDIDRGMALSYASLEPEAWDMLRRLECVTCAARTARQTAQQTQPCNAHVSEAVTGSRQTSRWRLTTYWLLICGGVNA